MLNMFIVSIIILLFLAFCGFTKPATPTSGPFRSYLVSARQCKKPTYPLHPKPSIIVEVELFNSTEGPGIRGRFDVLNYTRNVKIKIKSFIWENGKWKTNFALLDDGCRGSFMPILLPLFNVKFDKKKCAFLECKVSFNVVNVNKVLHLMTSTAEYGRIMFMNEMFMVGKQYKTFNCYEYETVIEPA